MVNRPFADLAVPVAPAGERRPARRRPASVRRYLLSLVIVCLLPVSLLSLITLLWAYHDGKQAQIAQATLESRALGRAVDAILVGAMNGLQAMSASPALNAGDFVAFGEEAKRALPYEFGNNIVLSDTSGRQVMNTSSPPGRPLPAHSDLAFQQRVIATGQPAVSDLFYGRVLQRPAVAAEVPVRRGPGIAYTLAMGFLPERFAAILSQQAIDPRWIVAIFDSRGVIIARTHEARRYVGQKGPAALLDAMKRHPDGVAEVQSLEGVPLISAYTRSRITGWTVAVGVPRQLLLARLERWTGWLAVAGLVLLLTSVVAAQALALRISGAFGALIPAAQALGDGERVGHIPVAVAEAEEVVQALSRASQLLHARTQERDAATRSSAAERTRAQHFARAAQHDALTGLLNRARFVQLVGERLAEHRARGQQHFCVLFLDLDKFKPINDRYGHAVGDELLCAFAARLRASVRSHDIVARLGGDEFAVLIDGQGLPEIRVVAATLVERLSRPYAVQDLALHVAASIGVAIYPEHGDSADVLLNAADAAMYRAKRAGKSGFAISGFAPL